MSFNWDREHKRNILKRVREKGVSGTTSLPFQLWARRAALLRRSANGVILRKEK